MPSTPARKPAVKVDPKLANAWKTKSGRELTEAELLAMPESEYMNEKQIDFFRAQLEQQKDDLLSNAGQTTENLREDTSIVPDPADRATIEEEHALELRTRDRERKLLKKIAQSLARLDSGDYGYCDETGEPIGLARLLARPTATLSLEAQQRRELKQKMFGD
ncbi:MAG: RNA polymerase-binding protein DksA [Rubrivivax sp.]|nr:RNA polymerase-binding protein DksA [Rubrivivax sp.]